MRSFYSALSENCSRLGGQEGLVGLGRRLAVERASNGLPAAPVPGTFGQNG